VSYGGTRDFNDVLDPTAAINSRLGIQITKNWSLTYSNRWDLSEGKILGETLSLRRDLHCWEAEFTRNRLGNQPVTVYFRINVKSLSDIKYEQGEGQGTGISSISSSLFR
jgi:hypothetical protein